MRRDGTLARAAAIFMAMMICLLAPMTACAVKTNDRAEAELAGEDALADIQYGALLLINQWVDDAEALNTMEDNLTECGLSAEMIAAITAAVPGTAQSYMLLTYAPELEDGTDEAAESEAAAETTQEPALTDDEGDLQPPFYVGVKPIVVPVDAVDGVITFDVAAQHADMYTADAFTYETVKTEDVKNADDMLKITLNSGADYGYTHLYAYVEPTPEPTAEPTPEPTEAPTAEPTPEPTEAPTAEPTAEPTEAPTEVPTAEPTEAPTEVPTAEPTEAPTEAPTVEPTPEPARAASYLLGSENGLTILAVPADTQKDELPEGVMTADELTELLKNVGYTNNQIDAALAALLPEDVDDVNWALYVPAVAETDGTLCVEQAAYDVLAAAGLEGGLVVGTDVEAILPTLAPTEMPTEVVTEAPTEAATEEATAAPTIIPTEEPGATAAAAATDAATAEPTDAPAMDVQPALADGASFGVLLLPEQVDDSYTVYELSDFLKENGYTDDEIAPIVEQAATDAAAAFVPYTPAEDGEYIVSAEDEMALSQAGVQGVVAGDVVYMTSDHTLATLAPTVNPTAIPTDVPTEAPTAAPTEEPTETPTEAPTEAPTDEPTAIPTDVPTEAPTAEPTLIPTEAPTEAPTDAPTEEPTAAPTEAPAQSGINTGWYFVIAAVLILIGAGLYTWSKKRKG